MRKLKVISKKHFSSLGKGRSYKSLMRHTGALAHYAPTLGRKIYYETKKGK